jgi:FkbM family methyltransferase
VHAFEPFPKAFDALSDNPPNYSVHAMEVGEQDGMAPFRVHRFDAASSLLPIDETARATWKDGHLPTGERVLLVPVTRLDSFMRRHSIDRVDLLNIDARRADLAVLRSAGIRLSDIDRVQLELAATPPQHYQSAAEKPEVLEFMAARGFRLVETAMRSHGQRERLMFARQV